MLLAKELMLGDVHHENNVFWYDHVLLNLPRMKSFDLSEDWVSTIQKDGTLATDVVGFVDDTRPAAPMEGEWWIASQKVSKCVAHLGTQDASRKRNPPSRSPGPWAEIFITSNAQGIFISVSEKKWEKARLYISQINSDLETGHTLYKNLENKVGFLVYVAQAYPSMKPYLSCLYDT